MAQPSPFLPAAKLVDLARAGPSMAMPFGGRQSYPIPVREPGGGLSAAFVFAPQARLNPVEGLVLLAPTFVAHMDFTTGKLDRMVPIALLAGHAPGQEIGAHTMPRGLTYDTFMPLEARLLEDYDALLPWFAADARSGLPPEVVDAARDLRLLFWRLSEAPLSPYYHALGKDFFGWIDAIAP